MSDASSAGPLPPSGRLRALDGLRGFLALHIVVFHVYGERMQGLEALSSLRHGHFMVQAFIVLSGFCLTLSALRKPRGPLTARSYLRYFARRASRIVIPYEIGFFLSLLLVHTVLGARAGTGWDYSLHVDPFSVATGALLVQNFTGNIYVANHTYWFIPFLWQYQLLFPLLLLTLESLGRPAMILVSIALGAGVFALVTAIGASTPLFHLFMLFCFGMVAAHATTSHRWWRVFSSPALLWAMALLVCAYWWTLYPVRLIGHPSQFIGDAAWGAIVSAGIAGLACQERHPIARILRIAPLSYVGAISYSLYLVHAPIIALLSRYAVYPLWLAPLPAFALLCAGTLILSIPVAHLFCVLFELPFARGFSRERIYETFTSPATLRISTDD